MYVRYVLKIIFNYGMKKPHWHQEIILCKLLEPFAVSSMMSNAISKLRLNSV